MVRYAYAFPMLLPGTAWAHAGHIEALAGHDHWVAGAAIGLAVGVAVWGWLKGRDAGAGEAEADSDEAEA